MIRELLMRCVGRQPKPEVIPDPPPAPAGWTIVPCGTPGITSYEVETVVPQDWIRPGGPGQLELVGLNALEFHGFPPETLAIGRCNVRAFMRGGFRLFKITYRFDYWHKGWQISGPARKPVFDYARLPLGSPELMVPVQTPPKILAIG